MPSPLVLPLVNWARKLRYPVLFKITAALFTASMLLPDPIPFLDEIVLAFGTILLARWKKQDAIEPAPGNR